MNRVLRVKDLKISLMSKKGETTPVQNVNFNLYKGETLALVGESGSGKSLTALTIMGLLQSWNSYVKPKITGDIEFTGRDGVTHQLTTLSDKQYDAIRGKDLSIIFQEPLTSLNPVVAIGKQISEVILAHERVSKQEAKERAIELLKKVKIPEPELRYQSYPHQFSGGQLQRIMIAMAIACGPSCLIADEPTTALDVTIQHQVLKLMQELQQEQQLSILLITHDLGIVSQFANKVAVMYAGLIVEYAPVEQLFSKPCHPYTQMLIQSIPTLQNEPGTRLLTKRDFLEERGTIAGNLLFDPQNSTHSAYRVVGVEHYVSDAYTKEKSGCVNQSYK